MATKNSSTRALPAWERKGNKVRIVTGNPFRIISANDLDAETIKNIDDEIICVDMYRNPSSMHDYAFKAIANHASDLMSETELRAAVDQQLDSPEKIEALIRIMKENYDGFDFKTDPVGTAFLLGVGFLADGMRWIDGIYDEDSNPVGYKLTRLGRIAKEVIYGTATIVDVP